tara:strand:+ start:897 stop:1280 length:384 start_codon:yes stop_codon:yes gene_type:complete
MGLHDENDLSVKIYKIVNFSSAHKLDLPYESRCNTLHGHNYKSELWIEGKLDKNGMVIDFHDLKKVIKNIDHINLSEKFEWQTTAENLSKYLLNQIYQLSPNTIEKIKVRVWETDTAYAEVNKSFIN